MQIEIQVPVLFQGVPPKGKSLKHIVAFLPMTFEALQATDEEAPLAVTVQRRDSSIMQQFRQHEDKLYRAIFRDRGEDSRIFGLQESLQSTIDSRFLNELKGCSYSKLYFPSFGQEMENEMKSGRKPVVQPATLKDFHQSGQRIPFDETTYSTNSDFLERKHEIMSHIVDLSSTSIEVGGRGYTQCYGPVWSIEINYNRTIIVEQKFLGNLSTWDFSVTDQGLYRSHETFYFPIAERGQAYQFAAQLSEHFDQRISDRDSQDHWKFWMPEREISQPDLTFPEFYRSARMFSFRVGAEIARRIKNNEQSIFTEDPKYRYAFDRLNDSLKKVDPFGQHDVELENATLAMRDLLLANRDEVESKYRKLISKNQKYFDHLDFNLSRLQDNMISIPMNKISGC